MWTPTFFADMCGAAIWDTISLWTSPFAGILLLLNDSLWPYFGLTGGMYLYFVGRGITSNLTMQRHRINIGLSEKLKVKYMILTLWGFIAFVTIIMAVIALI